MNSPPPKARQPLQANPARRTLHVLLSLGGWVMFVYWWWLVFRRVNQTEIRFTLWFLSLSFVAIVLATMLWALHNLRLFRKRGRRTHIRTVLQDASHDTIGRPVGMPGVPHECVTAGLIVIRIENGAKVYRPTLVPGVAPTIPTGTGRS